MKKVITAIGIVVLCSLIVSLTMVGLASGGHFIYEGLGGWFLAGYILFLVSIVIGLYIAMCSYEEWK